MQTEKHNLSFFERLFQSNDAHTLAHKLSKEEKKKLRQKQNQAIEAAQKEKYFLQSQADNFLQAQALIPFIKMQQKGYAATPAQKHLFDGLFTELLGQKNIEEVATLLDMGLELNHTHYIRLLFNYNIQTTCLPLSKNTSSPSLKLIQKNINKYSHIADYNNAAFNYLLETLETISLFFDNSLVTTENEQQKTYEKMCELISTEIFNVIDIIIKDVPLPRYSKTIAWLKSVCVLKHTGSWATNSLDYDEYELHRDLNKLIPKINECWSVFTKQLLENMKSQFETRYPVQIENTINRTTVIYMENYVTQKAKIQSTLATQNYSLTQLDDTEQTLVKTIKTHYEHLSQYTLNPEDEFNITSLVQEKLPKYINDFLSMSEEYRQTMTNSKGKTAQALLHEALSNILENLQRIEYRLNEQKITELSVAVRYTQEKLN